MEEKLKIDKPVKLNFFETIGIGKVKVNKARKVKVSMDLLKKAIRALDGMDFEDIEIIIKDENNPAVLGVYDNKRKEAVGIIIAPKLPEEDDKNAKE